MITMESYWMGRDTKYTNELTDEIRANAEDTVNKANQLLEDAGMRSIEKVNSGWRPKGVNDATSNAASRSLHIVAKAIDFYDPNGDLDKWCLRNLDVLKAIGLWQEHPGWTDGWCHVQTVGPGFPPKPGPRVFIPSSAPPATTIYGTAPHWDA